MDDSSAAMQARYAELMRAQRPCDRLAVAVGLSTTVQTLARAGIAARYAMASARELDARYAALVYGAEVAARLFADVDLGG